MSGTYDRIVDAGLDGPWDFNEDGLWCPHCGDIIAPEWFFDRDPAYEPPATCRSCGYPDFGQ